MFLGSFRVALTVIQTVDLNRKFHSFLVQILIRKDNTDNKGNFMQKKRERNW